MLDKRKHLRKATKKLGIYLVQTGLVETWMENHFDQRGERGGEAHDEELLALLRGVSSSKANITNRFAEKQEGSQQEVSKSSRFATEPTSFETSPQQVAPKLTSAPDPSPFPTGEAEKEIIVTRDDLPSAFSDKNWKL